MSSRSHARIQPPRWSGTRRLVIVAATAATLSATGMALSTSAFASDSLEDPVAPLGLGERVPGEDADDPIATLAVGETEVAVPDLGIPLPTDLVQGSTEIAGITATVGDARSEEEGAAESDEQQPAADPAEDQAQTGAVEPAEDNRRFEPAPLVDTEQATRKSTPTSAVATTTNPRADEDSRAEQASVEEIRAADVSVVEESSPLTEPRREVIRAAATLGAEKSAPVARSGLGLAAPRTEVTPERESGKVDAVHTIDLTNRQAAPPAASGDWGLMPVAGFAAFPLAVTAGVVAAYGRHGSRKAAAPPRRRHASS